MFSYKRYGYDYGIIKLRMQVNSIFILGRQPAIGRAELESVLGSGHVQPIGDTAVGSDVDPADIAFSRLGSSVRLAKNLATLNATEWPKLMRNIASELPKHLSSLPEGKLKLGISTFGLSVTPQHLFKSGLELKKVCKKAHRSVRLVPNTEPALSSAQVLHNQLTGSLGIELLLMRDGQQTWLAQTVAVQDINAYARRDQGRPKRDARVGMLSPKLAQTIVNLATAQTSPLHGAVVLDPFCGTGVVLQEASMMGFGIYGSDLEPRMIEYTDQNLLWLRQHLKTPATHAVDPDGRYYRLEVGDATTHHWNPPPSIVASEVYLGRPLSNWPNPETLQDIMGACNVITEKFLQNIATQLPAGARLCLAVPAWRAPSGRLYHLPLLDHLEKMGYNRLKFEYVPGEDLVYYRPNQLVARELLVIIKK